MDHDGIFARIQFEAGHRAVVSPHGAKAVKCQISPRSAARSFGQRDGGVLDPFKLPEFKNASPRKAFR